MGLLGRLTGYFSQSASHHYTLSIGGTYGSAPSARESLPSVVRAISLLSGDMARITPRILRGDEILTDHSSLSLLTRDANPHMGGASWRSWMVATALTHGVSYSFIQRDTRGDAIALWPLAPGRVAVSWDGLAPTYTLDGSSVDAYTLITLMASAPEPSNPYSCLSPLARCAPALSLAVLQERVATSIAQAGRVGKISITHPGTLSTTAKMDILDAYTSKHVSPEGASRPLVLDENVKVERVADSATGTLLDDRRYATMEVARALGIPPQMLYQGDAGALTSQIEIQRQYVEGTIAPWCSRLSEALTLRLTQPGERIDLPAQQLTRGNLRDSASALKDLSFTGALTVADARDLLGLAPSPDRGNEVVFKHTAKDVEP